MIAPSKAGDGNMRLAIITVLACAVSFGSLDNASGAEARHGTVSPSFVSVPLEKRALAQRDGERQMDLAERLTNDPKNPTYLVPAGRVGPR